MTDVNISVRPQVLRKADGMRKIRAVHKREGFHAPTELYSAWSYSNICKVGKAAMGTPTNTQVLIEYQDTKDIAIAFNGTWRSRTEQRYQLLTQGEPYIATISDGKQLSVGVLGGATETFVGSYVACELLRGWKSVVDTTDDQGLLLFAKKAYANIIDVYAYKNIGNGNTWLKTGEILCEGTVLNMQAELLTDYRWSLTVTTSTGSKMYISDRTYIARAVPSESWMFSALEVKTGKAILIPITDVVVDKVTPENITFKALQVQSNIVEVYSTKQPSVFYAENIGDTDIFLYMDAPTRVKPGSTLASGFKIKDSLGGTVVITEATHNPYVIHFKCTKFNNAMGIITIDYLGKGPLVYSNNVDMPAFKCDFVPIGLVPDDIPAPKVTKIISVEVL